MEQEFLNDIDFPDFGITSTTTESISSDELGELVLGGTGSLSSDPDDVVDLKDKVNPKVNPVADSKKKVDQTPPVITDEDVTTSILGDETKTEESNIEDTDNASDSEPIDEHNPIEIIANDLFKIGIFNKQDDEEDVSIKTPEELKDRFVSEVKAQANNQIYNFLLENHGEEGLEMFQSIFVNGVSPKDYLSKYVEIENVSNLDITNEANQEKVYKMYYRSLEWDEQDIEDSLTKLKEYGDLENESQKIQKKLVTRQEKELAQIEQNKVQEAKRIEFQKSQYETAINSLLTEKLKGKEFDGIPLTDKLIAEAKLDLTRDRYRLPNGEKLTEFDKFLLDLKRPENFEKRAKIWLLEKTGFDFSKIKQKAISQKQDELFQNLTIKEKTKKVNRTTTNNEFTSFLG